MKLFLFAWVNFHSNFLETKKLRFASWWVKKYPGKYCWADCVSWAISYKTLNPFKIEKSHGCKRESMKHADKTCYCGEWENGRSWALATKEEVAARLKEVEEERSHFKNEIPF